jgi:L-asparaginase/Glu-tRNA(Gln) amidotransferase subunit D
LIKFISTPRANLKSILRKDSLDLTDKDRALIRKRVTADPAARVVVTHSRDTMIQTALALKGIPGKTIILTGSMQPARLRVTDAGLILAPPSQRCRHCHRVFISP